MKGLSNFLLKTLFLGVLTFVMLVILVKAAEKVVEIKIKAVTYYDGKMAELRYKTLNLLDASPMQETFGVRISREQAYKIIETVSNEEKVNPALVKALVGVESNWKSDAIGFNPHLEARYGKLGASDIGLMQVSGRWANTRICPEATSPTDLFNPTINVRCGVRLLAENLKTTGKVKDGLSTYNCGKTECAKGQEYAHKIALVLLEQVR